MVRIKGVPDAPMMERNWPGKTDPETSLRIVFDGGGGALLHFFFGGTDEITMFSQES